MKIRVDSAQIVKAVKKTEGIEIVVETEGDALEGVNLILRRPDSFKGADFSGLKEIRVTPHRTYETSAVEYRTAFLLDFVFDSNVDLDARVKAIRAFQQFLERL